MNLEEYLWKSKRTIREFSNNIDCTTNTIIRIKQQAGSPNLLLALKIVEESDHKVDLESLLSKDDAKKIKEIREKKSPS